MKRAQQAMELLQQGVPILDIVHEVGYFDQPHPHRALKQSIGHTPPSSSVDQPGNLPLLQQAPTHLV